MCPFVWGKDAVKGGTEEAGMPLDVVGGAFDGAGCDWAGWKRG